MMRLHKEKASRTRRVKNALPKQPSPRTAQRDNRFSTEARKWHGCVESLHEWASRKLLGGLRRGCDFLQSHHPSNIAIFVNSFPILIRFRGFKLDRLIADTALRWSQFVDKSQECWQCAASERRIGLHKECRRARQRRVRELTTIPSYDPLKIQQRGRAACKIRKQGYSGLDLRGGERRSSVRGSREALGLALIIESTSAVR